MSYLISQLKSDLERKMHGTTLNQLASPDDLIYEAARNLLSKIDPQETKRITQITNGVYNQVYSYLLPSDLKGSKIISVLPQASVNPSDNLSQTYNEKFEMYKGRQGGISDIEYNDGIKSLRLSVKGGKAGKTLNTCDSLTANGTWAASGNASNLIADTLTKFAGSASLRFDLAASGSAGVITNSTMAVIDGSVEEGVGSVFVPFYFPNPTAVTSVDFVWGSSASDTWTSSATTASDSTAFKTGWNLLRFDWASATSAGTPDATVINYSKATINYDGTETPNCRMDNIVIRLGEIYDLKYYSKFLFSTSAGVWKEAPTADTDIVNLDTDSYNVLLYEAAFLATQEIQGEDGVFDRNYWEAKGADVYRDYSKNNRSEAIKSQSNYNRRLYTARRNGGSPRIIR